jgi:hypothetical protein
MRLQSWITLDRLMRVMKSEGSWRWRAEGDKGSLVWFTIEVGGASRWNWIGINVLTVPVEIS